MAARRNAGFAGAGLVVAGGLAAGMLWMHGESVHLPLPAVALESDSGSHANALDEDESDVLTFRAPSGRPAELSCDRAHVVIRQVRTEMLAYEAEPVTPSALASGVADWMDPYGLWTAAPDSPVSRTIDAVALDLLTELEGSGPCPSARLIGSEQVAWIGALQLELARGRASQKPHARAWNEPFTELARDDEPASELAFAVGERLGAIERALGSASKPFVDDAAARFLPALSEQKWGDVSLAAAVRAYVPLVDPHGAWAPDGEESSVYDLDLESRPPERAWTKASRTVLGIRIDEGALLPLVDGDVVLEIDGLRTAGLPPEQIDQAAFAAANPDAAIARVPRDQARIERLQMTTVNGPSVPTAANAELTLTRVAYGSAGDVVIVSVTEVPDDLGARFARAVARASSGSRPLMGIVIDLRGNGGGSTEGAIDVLGTVLPNAPLFPMKRRDGTIEADRAPMSGFVYRGPLATLVDPATASAAEMLAGALGAYHRAPIVGTPTYGKGCAQEYADDDAHAGVLRLTTLLYALPDGSPVQRVGLVPWARVPFLASDLEASDREATLPHAPPTWSGPDVRDPELVKKSFVAWSNAVGAIGPCKEERVCEALGMLTTASPRERRSPTAHH